MTFGASQATLTGLKMFFVWHSPVGDEAEEDVAKEASHVEEGGAGGGPPVPITDQIKLKRLIDTLVA